MANIKPLPRIFIGGTGRSGTWLLYRALGSHPQVHTFQSELRFMVDPGGLPGLIDDLTSRYSPARAREALFEFEKLMRIHMATPGQTPYGTIDLPAWVGRDCYWSRLDQFVRALVDMEYRGRAMSVEVPLEGRVVKIARKFQSMRQKQAQRTEFDLFQDRSILREPKYFSDRQQLLQLTASFVDDILMHAAREHGKLTWSEKTPQHLIHLDFIWELFPQSVFIHMLRDPRGVVLSLVKQPWGPNDIAGATRMLSSVYRRWFDLKKTLDLSPERYLEVRLEELAEEPQPYLQQVVEFCGLENQFGELPKFDPRKVSYWRNDLPKTDLDLMNLELGPYIEALGYKI